MALEFTAALLFRSFVAQPFTIPSGSMTPTLEVGDYVVASKFSYGYSNFSLPLGEALPAFSFASKVPQRGDVVIFKLPSNPSIDYIMRVIGLPGDTVQVIDGITHVNGKPLPLTSLGNFSSARVDAFSGEYQNVPMFEEALPEGGSHKVLDLGLSEGDNTPVFNVPAGNFFVMGDNRDNASDSRFSVRFVPAANIYAKAIVAITWPDGKFTMRDIK